MTIDEIFAIIGAKIDEGEFADVFALLDHVADYAGKVAGLVEDGIVKAFETIEKVAGRGDYLEDLAEQFAESAQAIQELGYVATFSGGSVEGLEGSLKFLAKAAQSAAEGGKEALAAFDGVKVKDATGKLRPLEDLISDLADSFGEMPDDAGKATRAIDLFGKSGQSMVGMMNRGSEGIARLRAEAAASGYVISDAAIKASGEFDDAQQRFNISISALENRFASPLIAKTGGLWDKATKILRNPATLRAIDALSKGFDRFLSVVGGVLDVLDWLTSKGEDATLTLFALQSAVIALGVAAAMAAAPLVAAGVATATAWIAAALPFIAIGALILLLVDELWTFAEGGDTVLGDMIKWFDKFDPADSPFIALLKAALSLIFDITDPKKWEKLAAAAMDFMNPLKQLAAFAELFREQDDTQPMAEKFPGLEDPLSIGSQTIPEKIRNEFPGLADPLQLGENSFAQSIATKFPGIPGAGTFWGSASGDDAGSRYADFMSGNRNQWATAPKASTTTIDAPISIVVPPGVTDPVAVGEEVRRVVREELGAELSNANAASGGS